MSIRDLAIVLGDSSLSWTQRRTRLQGWRGDDAACADKATGVQRLAPAVCAAGAAAGALAESPVVLGAFAVTALMGAVGANHPFELVYNRVAAGRDRQTLPANRAAKRFGCAIGAVFLGSAAVAYALGAATVGLVLALVLGGTAAFVAATGVCVPSMLFTLMWGVERATAPSLRAAATGREHAGDLRAGTR